MESLESEVQVLVLKFLDCYWTNEMNRTAVTQYHADSPTHPFRFEIVQNFFFMYPNRPNFAILFRLDKFDSNRSTPTTTNRDPSPSSGLEAVTEIE